MSEQEPASQEMRWLFHVVMEQANTTASDLAVEEPHLQAQIQALYSRIQQEEQQLQEARALLEKLAEIAPDGYSMESSYRCCPYCDGDSDRTEFPAAHKPDCPWLQARAYLSDHSQRESEETYER